MASITASTIKPLLKPHVYTALCGGGTDEAAQNTYCETVIEAARVQVTSMLAVYKKDYDETLAVHKQAVMLITIYELYARVENEEVAADKKQQAITLLANTYAGGAPPASSTTTSKTGGQIAQGTAYRQPIASVQQRQSIKDKVLRGIL